MESDLGDPPRNHPNPLRFLMTRRISRIYGAEGLSGLWRRVVRKVGLKLSYPLERIRWFPKRFEFDGKQLSFHIRPYNHTWHNERCIEVAVARELVTVGSRILEVGNVLTHYGAAGHDILDKYEVAPGVINIDVVDFESTEPYERIVAISTLEHVGWDEPDRDEQKALDAIHRLRRFLTSNGELLVTFSLGYHPGLDRAVLEGRFDTLQEYFYERIGRREWVNRTRWEIEKSRYDYQSEGGCRVLWIGRFGAA